LQMGEFELPSHGGYQQDAPSIDTKLSTHKRVSIPQTAIFESYRTYSARGDQKFSGKHKDATVTKTLEDSFGVKKRKLGPIGSQVRCFEFGTIADMRERFSRAMCEANWVWDDDCV